MKGVSDIIAMLLMLVITIAIAGLAYGFISGAFTGRIAVVLSVDGLTSICNVSHITAHIRNDGTATSGLVTVTALRPGGVTEGTCTISNITAGRTGNCTMSRVSPTGGLGVYTITASAAGASTALGTVHCAS